MPPVPPAFQLATELEECVSIRIVLGQGQSGGGSFGKSTAESTAAGDIYLPERRTTSAGTSIPILSQGNVRPQVGLFSK